MEEKLNLTYFDFTIFPCKSLSFRRIYYSYVKIGTRIMKNIASKIANSRIDIQKKLKRVFLEKTVSFLTN